MRASNASQAEGAPKQEIVLKSYCFINRTYYVRHIMVDHVNGEPKFELIGSDGLFSGLRHLRHGIGHDDPTMPFTLTLTPQYVAREIRKTLPVSYLKVQRYAKRNADKLKAIAKFERERGVSAHTLQ